MDEGLCSKITGLVHAHFKVSKFLHVSYTVQRLATGWAVRRSNPDGDETFHALLDSTRAHPTSYKIGTGSLSRAKIGQDVALNTHLYR